MKINSWHGQTCCLFVSLAAVCWLSAMGGCSKKNPAAAKEVVVYTCLDQVYSEPILKQFEKASGIKVRAVYDTEAAKTTGLVNRLLARKDNPDCDVFWNNESAQTARLADKGLLATYESPQAKRFPAQFRDPQFRWTGFAARMRVIIYNTERLGPNDLPIGLADLAAPKWKGQTAIARPFFGTTLTHMAVLHQAWGPDRLREYLLALKGNDVALCLGNATVRDMVASGDRAFGLTDTDDAYGAMLDGKPVKVLIPDPAEGAVLIPNTVAMVAGCPHPETARKLIDYLLSAEVERQLAASRSAQIPLAKDLRDISTPWDDLAGRDKFMPFDTQKASTEIPKVISLLRATGMNE